MRKLKWNRKLSILVLIMFITVTFASFNTNLFIDGNAYVRVDRDIRITDIHLLETEYNGYENTNSEYTNRTISTDVSLPRQASSLTYEVTISNVSDRRYKITDIIEDSYDNRDVKYELIDASIGNIVEPHTTKTFRVKFTNNVTVVEEDDVYQTLTYTFDYTGGEQEFVVPYDGTYTLEVWGAQGGSYNETYHGGYGGYSKGNINLRKNQVIYVNVGESGQIFGKGTTVHPGGYNGGGSAKSTDVNVYVGTGGGATHISNMKGTLSTLKNKGDNILIVAGGGGGSLYYYSTVDNNYMSIAGSGGGASGTNSEIQSSENYTFYDMEDMAGTQTYGGKRMASIKETASKVYSEAGSFGKGGGAINLRTSGGGGGYYGGAGGSRTGGGGGSGYIGNTLLTSKEMYCYQCEESNDIETKTINTDNHSSTATSEYAKEGNGYAKITITRKIQDGSEYNFDYTGGEQTFIAPYTGVYQLETWGAQGGYSLENSDDYIGGYGGYSNGKVTLKKGEQLYVYVGGEGESCRCWNASDCCGEDGGYNGGGKVIQYTLSPGSTTYGSGGGATHIATVSGLLSTLENQKDKILIVSGGGGGASHFSTYNSTGGSAGGFIGSIGTNTKTDRIGECTGGSQDEPGTGIGAYRLVNPFDQNVGSAFGQGGYNGVYLGPGAGGGFYGGGTTEIHTCGGSGYIGNDLLSEKVMYCYQCEESPEIKTKTVSTNSHSLLPKQNAAKEGNGYTRITLDKRTINRTNLTLDFTFEEYVNGNEYVFGYTGASQVFTVPKTGYYKVELWGASGNNHTNDYVESHSAYGGYTSGKIKLNKGEKLYVYVGGIKNKFNTAEVLGGNGSGGATDIRLIQGENWYDLDSLSSRIMVAGGAGGTYSDTSGASGGAAGGLSSYSVSHYTYPVNSTYQTSGGKGTYFDGSHSWNEYIGNDGSFGVGGNSTNGSGYASGAGGYYGGGSGPSGGGGSSFISGHNGCIAITAESDTTPRNDSNGNQCDEGTTDITCSKHYSNYIFTDTKMIDGKGYEWTTTKSTEYSGMPTYDGLSTMTGNDGTGFAKITCLEETEDYTYDYTGGPQEFVAPYKGIYKVELWGASGGKGIENQNTSLGAYTSGKIELSKNEKIYLYLGAEGKAYGTENLQRVDNEFNGGGPSRGQSSISARKFGQGGSASDIRIIGGNWDSFNSLKTRIMTAAGGGGNYTELSSDTFRNGGSGGGLIGYDGVYSYSYGRYGSGGTQISGGYTECMDETYKCATNFNYNVGDRFAYGGFGIGGTNIENRPSQGGGSGYYGGGGSEHCNGAGGGSSYISGHPGCVSITEDSTSNNITFVNDSNGIACDNSTSSGYNVLGYNTDTACNKHFSGYTFTDTVMIDGKGYQWDENGKGNTIVGMPSKDGRTTMIGNTGNGFARITLVDKIDSYKIDYDLDGGTLKNKRVSYSEYDDDITLGKPTKEGYTFTGWTGGRNILDMKNTSKTSNGITYTVNADKSITINGTATNYSFFYLNDNTDYTGGTVSEHANVKLKKNQYYYFNGKTTAKGNEGYLVEGCYKKSSGTSSYVKGKFLTPDEDVNIVFYIKINPGAVIENETIYPYLTMVDEDSPYDWTGTGGYISEYEAYDPTPTQNMVIPSRSHGHRKYTAHWVKNYDINYELDGGTISNAKTNYYNLTNTIEIPDPIKSGYKFTGWTGGKSIFSNQYILSQQVSGPTGKRGIFDVKPNTYYTLSTNLPLREDNGKYILLGADDDVNAEIVSGKNGAYAGHDMTVKSTENGHILISYFRTLMDSEMTTKLDNGEYWFQIEEGDHSTPYETYISTPTKNISIAAGASGNRTYTANWTETTDRVVYFNWNYNMVKNGEMNAKDVGWTSKNGGTASIDRKVNYNGKPSLHIIGNENDWSGAYTTFVDTENGYPPCGHIYFFEIHVYKDSTSEDGDITQQIRFYYFYRTNNGTELYYPGIGGDTIYDGMQGKEKTWVRFYRTMDIACPATNDYNTVPQINVDSGNAGTINNYWISGVRLYIQDPVTKTMNTKIGTLPTPTRNGYTFKGWYTSSTNGELITKDYIVTKDVEIYAHWSKN